MGSVEKWIWFENIFHVLLSFVFIFKRICFALLVRSHWSFVFIPTLLHLISFEIWGNGNYMLWHSIIQIYIFTKFRFDIVLGIANTFIGWWGLKRCDPKKKLKFIYIFHFFNFPIHEFYRILLCSYCAFGGLVTTHGNHTPWYGLLTSHCCLPLVITSPSWRACFLWSPWC